MEEDEVITLLKDLILDHQIQNLNQFPPHHHKLFLFSWHDKFCHKDCISHPSFGTNHKIYYLHDSSTLYMYVIFLYKCRRLKSSFLGHLHGHAVILTLLCLLCLTAKVDQGWNPRKDSNIRATLPLYLKWLLIVQFSRTVRIMIWFWTCSTVWCTSHPNSLDVPLPIFVVPPIRRKVFWLAQAHRLLGYFNQWVGWNRISWYWHLQITKMFFV